MNNEVFTYLNQKGFDFKIIGSQYNLKTCPLCRDEKFHFYINSDNGLWDCKKCGEFGNLFQLKQRLGDMQRYYNLTPLQKPSKNIAQISLEGRVNSAHQNLLNDESALKYLTEERALSLEMIKRFKLGLEKESEINWLLIPHYQNGKALNIKLRSLPPAEKGFKRIPDHPSILFNGDVISQHREIIITEGELDAISLIQAGFPNVVGNVLGAGSFAPEWVDLFAGKKVYLCYDSDEAGMQGAEKLSRRLDCAHCFKVEIPVNDVNEWLKANPAQLKENFAEALKNAAPFIPENLYPLHQLIQQHDFDRQEERLLTPWDNVNQLVGGMRAGDLIVVSAPPKIGKTTFCLNIAAQLAKQEKPVLFYCLEMRPERLFKKIIQAEAGVMEEEITQQLAEDVVTHFPDNSFIFGYNYKDISLDSVMQTIRAGVKYFGVDLVVFDNLHYLARNPQFQTQEVSLAVKQFKLIAEELKIPLILIVQPKKTDESKVITSNDLRDSSLIGADADQVIVLFREKRKSSLEGDSLTESFSPETLVRIEASRYTAGGDTLLNFQGELSVFARLEGGEN